MNIIFGTDFSEEAARAGRVAALLAKKLGDTIEVVHVTEPWVAYPAVAPHSAYFAVDVTEGDRLGLERATDEVRKHGVPAEQQLRFGTAGRVLPERAAELGARLVVLGGARRGAFDRFLLGSASEQVIRRARSPVLVVRGAIERMEKWLHGEASLSVAVAIDETPASDVVVAWASVLRSVGPCDLTFLHFFWPPEHYRRLGFDMQPSPTADAEVMEILQRDLGAKIGTVPGDGTQALVIRPIWGTVGDVLVATAKQLHADLLVVGAHQRHGMDALLRGSVAREVIEGADLSVACVPASASIAATSRVPQVRHVLAATDLSRLGNRAVLHAVSLAEGSGGVVEVVHVVEQTRPGPGYADYAKYSELAAERRAQLDAMLTELLPPDSRKAGVTISARVVFAPDAAQGITSAAERWGADVICLGAARASRLAKVLLGSTSRDVVRAAVRPVLIVPEQ